MQRKELDQGAWYSYGLLSDDMKMNNQEFEDFWDSQPEEQAEVLIYGKMIKIPRKQQSYGISYRFSGVLSVCTEITPLIQKYIDYANSIDDTPGKFNMALVNWYENGKSYIGYHSDDEKQLIQNSPVYCFSFGVTRDFKLKKISNGETINIKLEPAPAAARSAAAGSRSSRATSTRAPATTPRSPPSPRSSRRRAPTPSSPST